MVAGGAQAALMSGSGPTVFGIFEKEEIADEVGRDIRAGGLAKQVYTVKPLNVVERIGR